MQSSPLKIAVQKIPDWFEGFDVVTEDFECSGNRHREDNPRAAPNPAPVECRYQYRGQVHVDSATDEFRCEYIPLEEL